VHFVNKQTRFY